jgi:hypothetical protein
MQAVLNSLDKKCKERGLPCQVITLIFSRARAHMIVVIVLTAVHGQAWPQLLVFAMLSEVYFVQKYRCI